MLINPKQPIIRQIKEGEYEYQADLYDAKVFFNDPQADDYNHLMRIVKYDKELIFKMLNASPTNITVDKDNQLTYHNVFEGVDTVYTLYPDKVKEDIIINSPESEHVFKFRVYESLPATMQDSGDIFYCDNDNDNQQVFELPAPYATDTNNNTVDVEMIHEEGYYTYKVIPNKNTVYPIILDPTVTVGVSYNITSVSFSKYEKGKYESTAYMYLNDFGIKIKSIKFSLYRNNTYNASSDSTISFYNEENTLLKTLSATKGTTTYPVYDITDDINKIIFYSMASNDRQSGSIYSSAYNGISIISYDSEDGYIPAANIIKSANIFTIDFTSTMKMNVNDISFLSYTNTDEPQDISINSITVNNNDVDINNFSIESGDSVIIKAYSPNCTPKAVGLRYVTQKLLSMNENIIEAGNNQFNLEEYVVNGGNSDINTKEFISANETSELPIKINVNDSLKERVPVYSDRGDTFLFVEHAFSELANYIKIVGCTVKSSETCECVYTDYNDNDHSFSVSSTFEKSVSDKNGIKSVREPIDAFNFSLDYVAVERFDANLEPGCFVYDNDIITSKIDNHFVKIVNGDIYKVIDLKKGKDPDNLIPLGRDKVLLQSLQHYYVKCKESPAVGVFMYKDNVTIEDSLLSMNEKIVNTPNIELIENIYATEKSGIQTKEYIIKGNGYQLLNVKEEIVLGGQELLPINENTIEAGNNKFNLEEYIVNGGISEINTKEVIYANESELLSINENIIGVGNDQFNIEERIVNSGNPDIINTKEVISANESSELPININVDTSIKEGIPVYGNERDTRSVVERAFNSELANYIKILGFTIESSSSCSCTYIDYNDNKHYFLVSLTDKKYIFDSDGIKSFRDDSPNTSSRFIHIDDVTVERFDANLEPDCLVFVEDFVSFRYDCIVKIVGGDIYELKNPNIGDYPSSNLIPLRDTTLVRKNKKYYVKYKESLVIGVFKYVNAAIENSLLPMNERICDNNATIENSLLPMNEKIYDNAAIKNSLLPINEKICYGSNVELIENIYAIEKQGIQTMEYIINGNGYQYINTKETISISSSDKFDINEKIYGIEKSKIPLIEKIVSDANSDLIEIKELVGTPDDTIIDIKENIQMASDLNIIEKVFAKDSILLPITEGITTENDSLIRILENVKNSSEDRLDIKEYIATGIGEEKLDIIEKITISDETVINIIENIVIDGYDCIPIEENIVINGNDKIDINENIVEKAEEKIVLLEEVKILGNDTVSIIENVKPVSLTIVESIRKEVDYATRLITFTKPTFTYKKGK